MYFHKVIGIVVEVRERFSWNSVAFLSDVYMTLQAADDVWHHVDLSYDGMQVHLCVDGTCHLMGQSQGMFCGNLSFVVFLRTSV